jgi:hypothetical protein
MEGLLPDWLKLAFLGVVAMGVSALLVGFRLLGRSGPSALGMRVVLLSWLMVPALFAIRGVIADFDAVPPMLLRFVVPIASVVTAMAFSRWGRRAALELPLSLLVGFQAFRFPLELILHALYDAGQLPREMTFAGYNFDIVTGASAFVLWVLLRTRDLSRRVVLAWNVMGTVLLVTVVTIAILSFPQPFGLFTTQNRIVAYFPWVWLPTFLVPLALLGHLLVFRRLLSSDDLSAAAAPARGVAKDDFAKD